MDSFFYVVFTWLKVTQQTIISKLMIEKSAFQTGYLKLFFGVVEVCKV